MTQPLKQEEDVRGAGPREKVHKGKLNHSSGDEI